MSWIIARAGRVTKTVRAKLVITVALLFLVGSFDELSLLRLANEGSE